jgi:hypothetical protein
MQYVKWISLTMVLLLVPLAGLTAWQAGLNLQEHKYFLAVFGILIGAWDIFVIRMNWRNYQRARNYGSRT